MTFLNKRKVIFFKKLNSLDYSEFTFKMKGIFLLVILLLYYSKLSSGYVSNMYYSNGTMRYSWERITLSRAPFYEHVLISNTIKQPEITEVFGINLIKLRKFMENMDLYERVLNDIINLPKWRD
jgi:hypothetical protein